MVFSSTIFLFAFLPVTLGGYYLLNQKFKNYFLLLASLFFYAWGEPKFVFVMIGSILVNYLFALGIDRLQHGAEPQKTNRGGESRSKPEKWAKALLVLMVLFNLSLFFVYKYLDFAITNINAVGSLFGARPIPLRNIALPIGISFFTFQAMSYVFDVYYGRGKVQKNPLNVMLYVALFPQLIAGPIVRYETVAAEINDRKETIADFAKGIKRFSIGLAKKAVLANTLAIVADKAFGYTDYSQLTVLLAWFGAVCYMLQLYFDFGGYSDMAIGLGLMFGFHFEENFNYPYISKTVGEFWRRWHISLGTWFRDYLFVPVSSSRWLRRLCNWTKKHCGERAKELVRTVVPLAIVWLCNGIWHGPRWTYITFGCWYGTLITLGAIFSPTFKRWTKKHGINRKAWWFQGLQIIRTLLLALPANILFRSENMGNAVRYLGSMFGLMGNAGKDILSVFILNDFSIMFLVGAVMSTPLLKFCWKKLTKGRETPVLDGVVSVGLLILSTAYIIIAPYNPFLYFNF